MARPRKDIDPKKVTQLARFGLSGDEIAVALDCSRPTIYRRFETALKNGHEHMRGSLRRRQYEVAMDGNPTMLIWLGKQHLNQRDRSEMDVAVTVGLAERIRQMRERMIEQGQQVIKGATE